MKNLAFALMMQVTYTLTSFITRTMLVKTLGVETAGLNGLFAEIIAVLSLTELGVGGVITYHLYKPLAEGDTDRLTRLMTLYRRAYRVFAGVTLLGGALLMPLLPLLITDVSLPMDYVRKVFALFVVQTASTYLLSYKSALIDADQKHYLVALVNAAARVAQCALCVAVLFLTREFLWYLAASIATNLLGNAVLSLLADRRYPFLKTSLPLPAEERRALFSNVRHQFVGKLSGRITNSTDNILISVMVSTALVGYYSYYALVFSSLRNLITQFSAAATGSIGNLMATESEEKCEETLRRLTYVFFAVTGPCLTALYCAFEPLIRVWLGESFVLGQAVLLCCVLNAYLALIRSPLFSMLDASGLFRENRDISLLASLVNLVVSVALAPSLGIVGILLGTVCTHIIQIALKTRLLFRKRLKRSARGFSMLLLAMGALFAVQLAAAGLVCGRIALASDWAALVLYALIGFGLSALSTLACSFKTPEFRYTRWLARTALGARK